MATLRGETQVATASYIESMLGELRGMSAKMNADLLSYLLEMAIEEAARIANTGAEDTSLQSHPKNAEQLAQLYMAGKLD